MERTAIANDMVFVFGLLAWVIVLFIAYLLRVALVGLLLMKFAPTRKVALEAGDFFWAVSSDKKMSDLSMSRAG